MDNGEGKRKNRYRDKKVSEFSYGKGVKKKKTLKSQFRKPKKRVELEAGKNKALGENQITGIYSGVAGQGFGFIDVEGEEKGHFVIDKNKNGAFDGDRVIADTQIYRGKSEAIIVEIVERAERKIVGELQISRKKSQTGGDFAFVIPKDKNFGKDIFISGKDLGGAKHGDMVGVELLSYHGKNPSGKILEILGKKGEEVSVDSYILEAGFSKNFDEELLESLEKKYSKISEKEKQGEISRRKDFRKLFTFTIDGEDAKDLDDAISIKKKENGSYLLYIHIADVAHYIEENTKLDKQAYKRATSVYLADRVIPMLPEILSNKLCSLNTESEKLSLTCEVLLDEKGNLVKSTLYESVIKSDFRLTYKEVDEIVQGQTHRSAPTDDVGVNLCVHPCFGKTLFCGLECTQELVDTLLLAEELRGKITEKKNREGVLNFDFPETKIILDENKKISEIKQYPRYESNKMIEEFMVTANEAVSRKFATFPFLYRIHETPAEEDREKLQTVLALFGIAYSFKNFDTKEVGELLDIIQSGKVSDGEGDFKTVKKRLSEGQKKFLEKTILRTLSKAIYSEENKGHFGLGLQFYSHFTSPIRRYPDLQIHRIIKEKLQGNLNQTREIHFKNILPTVAHHTSEQERKAEKLEYKVRDYYICDYYKQQVGKRFKATITTVLPYGVFVQLEDTAEGFLELIPKHGAGKGFVYDEQFMRFSHPDFDEGINLGDELFVELQEVDMELLRINFGLVSM